MSCRPGADEFIEKHFKDCVYNVRDYIGFCLGLAAIVFWVVAQLPQYYRNYKTQSAEALSPWFLAQWLLGDTFNLIGALLQGQQLPTTVYTAMYFVIADMFMMMQFIYYGALQRRREAVLKLQARRRHQRHHRHHKQQQHGSSSSTHDHQALSSPQTQRGPSPREAPYSQQQQQRYQQSSAPFTQQQGRQQVTYHTLRTQVPLTDRSQWTAGVDACQEWEHEAAGAGTSMQAHLQHSGIEAPASLDDRQPAQQHHTTVLLGADADTLDADASLLHDADSCCASRAQSKSSSQHLTTLSSSTTPTEPCGVTAVLGYRHRATYSSAAGVGGLPAIRGLPSIRAPCGSLRSVMTVGVLVTMGVVSVITASSTTAMPVTVPRHPGATAVHQQGDGSSARAIQAGSQQQQHLSVSNVHSIHATMAPLDNPTALSSGQGGVHVTSSSSTSRSWARQHRVGDDPPDHDWSFIVGTGLGYVACVLYLCSRLSQIHKNYTRKSSEGLALVMFMMAVCANLCTGFSIVMRTFSWTELTEQLPWIVGSLGTISLDMIILWQSRLYAQEAEHAGADGTHAHPTHHHHHHHHHHHAQPQYGRGERQRLLQSDEQQGTADGHDPVSSAACDQEAGAVEGMAGAAYHRGAVRGRRHLTGAAGADFGPDGLEVMVPLVGPST